MICQFTWENTHKCKLQELHHGPHYCHCDESYSEVVRKNKELLTAQELDALDKISSASRAIFTIVYGNDRIEAVAHIHTLQNMIMSRAASRAYPDKFRL